jgi:hypothetical protein
MPFRDEYPVQVRDDIDGLGMAEAEFPQTEDDWQGEPVYRKPIGRIPVDVNQQFSKLIQGKTIGKKIAIGIPLAAVGTTSGQINLLELLGSDDCATQLNLTLTPPSVIVDAGSPGTGFKFPFVAGSDVQHFSGDEGNETVTMNDLGLARFIASVEWGIGGIQSKVLVDFSNGLCLNLNASFLRVGAIVIPRGGQTFVATLGAFVGPGNVKPNNAQFTDAFVSIGAGLASAVTPIPKFGKTMRFCGRSVVPGSPLIFHITFWQDRLATISQGEFVFNGANPNSGFPRAGDSIPIPNGAYWYTITNDDVNGLVPMMVVTELAI